MIIILELLMVVPWPIEIHPSSWEGMLNATLKIAWVVFKRIFKLNSEVETTNIFKLGDDGGVVDLMVHQTEGNIGVLCLKAEARGTLKLIKIEAIISF